MSLIFQIEHDDRTMPLRISSLRMPAHTTRVLSLVSSLLHTDRRMEVLL